MGNGHAAGVARAIRTLWGSGAVGGLTDAQLIARFVERRDEAGEIAFEALVGRHGPMVLRVVRDVLRDPHSAQDAFQATFLVLARKAGSIARPETLGPWLYGVANRVARKARVEADRRRRHERQAAERAPTTVEPDVDRHDPCLGPTLHEEVARLPDPCRVAVVLCYFEGLTYDQAARRLGVTEATVRGRLARARRTLRGRLDARGAAAWALPPIPHRWICPTARAASRFAGGGKEAAPAHVAGLAEGVLRTMCVSKIKAAAVLLAFQLAAVAAVMARPQQQPVVDNPETPVAGTAARPRSEVPEMIRRPEEPDKPAHLALTLDEAILRMLREDDDLRSKFFEIPQAKADILTASLRANPEFYADSGLIPYGRYLRERPGGQTQYDANISYPLDLSRKRTTRTASAARIVRPTKVTEAQYVDNARMKIDGLASAFAEALEARDRLRLRLESMGRLDRLSEVAREDGEGAEGLRRIEEARAALSLERAKAVERSDRARLALASFLKLPAADAAGLEVVGKLGRESGMPPAPSLIDDALANRPDLIAYRLGVERAKSDVKLQYANRSQDVYVLAQPYTLQDNTPFGLKSPTSWALGITVPLPLYDRNQGNIQRAKLGVTQSQVEMGALERQVVSDVQQADRECVASLEAIPEAKDRAIANRYALDTAWERYGRGTEDLAGLLAASEQADEASRARVDALARLYRAKIALNTAVGRRVVQP